jgi:hypothetical protein
VLRALGSGWIAAVALWILFCRSRHASEIVGFRVKESVLRMKLIHKALTICSLALLAFAISCGHPQTLQSIAIDPSGGATISPISNPNPVYFRAIGSFISPTKTVDITNDPDVTWQSSIPAVATVVGYDTTQGAEAVVAAGTECGTTYITATAGKGVIGPGDADEVIVSPGVPVTVTDSSCAGSLATLTVSVTGAGLVNGVISNTSSTVISGCGSTGGANCVASEPLGTSVVLTASAPATFSSNCTVVSVSPPSCQVVMSTAATGVTVAF